MICSPNQEDSSNQTSKPNISYIGHFLSLLKMFIFFFFLNSDKQAQRISSRIKYEKNTSLAKLINHLTKGKSVNTNTNLEKRQTIVLFYRLCQHGQTEWTMIKWLIGCETEKVCFSFFYLILSLYGIDIK